MIIFTVLYVRAEKCLVCDAISLWMWLPGKIAVPLSNVINVVLRKTHAYKRHQCKEGFFFMSFILLVTVWHWNILCLWNNQGTVRTNSQNNYTVKCLANEKKILFYFRLYIINENSMGGVLEGTISIHWQCLFITYIKKLFSRSLVKTERGSGF